MTTDPRTLRPDQSVRDALELMQSRPATATSPWSTTSGHLVGVVRQVDILKFLAESFPEELLNLPPTTASAHGAGRRRMTTTTETPIEHDVQELDRVTIRFAGDSGDGMQLDGHAVHPDRRRVRQRHQHLPRLPGRDPRARPARCPACRASRSASAPRDIHTPGDAPDVLVAMNPAALKTNVGELPAGGALIVNSDAFTQQNLNKAAYTSNPLTDGSLKQFTVFEVPISTLNERSLEGLDMTVEAEGPDEELLRAGPDVLAVRALDGPDHRAGSTRSSARRPVIAEANTRALKAGYAYGETTEMFHTTYRVPRARLAPGLYRNITGNEATGLGFLDGVEARQARPVLRLVPDHAGVGHPPPAVRPTSTSA